jgi:hypothetical protein
VGYKNFLEKCTKQGLRTVSAMFKQEGIKCNTDDCALFPDFHWLILVIVLNLVLLVLVITTLAITKTLAINLLLGIIR